jgi:hypothetical protein
LESNLDLVHHGMTLPLHCPAPHNSAHTSQALTNRLVRVHLRRRLALTDVLACDA